MDCRKLSQYFQKILQDNLLIHFQTAIVLFLQSLYQERLQAVLDREQLLLLMCAEVIFLRIFLRKHADMPHRKNRSSRIFRV